MRLCQLASTRISHGGILQASSSSWVVPRSFLMSSSLPQSQQRDFSDTSAAAAAAEQESMMIKERYWKKTTHGQYQRPLYVAATRQHVWKTTVSLAVLSGLQKRFPKIGMYLRVRVFQ